MMEISERIKKYNFSLQFLKWALKFQDAFKKTHNKFY
jgi:hypothetical protein